MSTADESIHFTFPAGTDPNAIAGAVNAFFTGEKYKLETGQPLDAIYGFGSDTLRVLFGAFVKRFSFQSTVTTNAAGEVVLTLAKGMSGAMGGVIGYNQMNKETARIRAALSKHLGIA